MDPRKVQSIVEWPTPASCCEVRRFAGLANYYRRFAEGYAELAAPLTALGSPAARFPLHGLATTAGPGRADQAWPAPGLMAPVCTCTGRRVGRAGYDAARGAGPGRAATSCAGGAVRRCCAGRRGPPTATGLGRTPPTAAGLGRGCGADTAVR